MPVNENNGDADEKLAGIWWLPDQPETVHGGFLHLQDMERPYLEFVSNSSDPYRSVMNKWSRPTVIWGNCEKVGPITLFDSLTPHNKYIFAGPPTDTFFKVTAKPIRIVEGIHCKKLSDVVVKKFSVRNELLQYWSTCGINNEVLPPYDHKFDNDSIKVEFATKPKKIVLSEINDDEISLCLANDINYNSQRNLDCWVEVNLHKPLNLEKCLELKRRIDNFFSFAVSNYFYGKIFAFADKKRDEDSRIIKVIDAREKRRDSQDKFWEGHWLFWLESFYGKCEPLKKWLELYGEMKEFFDRLATLSYAKHYLEDSFYQRAILLEHLHRNYFPPEEYRVKHKEAMDELLSDTPDKHKAWVKKKCRFHDPRAFKDRITGIVREWVPYLEEELLPDLDQLAGKIAATRNQMAHGDPNPSLLAAQHVEEFAELTKAAGILLDACVLHLLGFLKMEVLFAVKTCSKYRSFLKDREKTKSVLPK